MAALGRPAVAVPIWPNRRRALLRSRTTSRVRVLNDRCAAALDPEAIRRRQERARQHRDVFLTPREDGISRFCADVPTPVAVLARSVIDRVAQSLPSERTIGQRRADVFADLFTRLAAHGHIDLRPQPDQPDQVAPTTGENLPIPEPAAESDSQERVSLLPPDWERIDSGVTVVIDAATLAGVNLTDVPAIEGALQGSQPALPADLVHTLALSATRARIAIRGTSTTTGATDCRYGCASTATNLTVGADIHRPPAKLAEQIVLRDRTCRFPGCRHPARACDLDHRRPFDQGGPTTAENLTRSVVSTTGSKPSPAGAPPANPATTSPGPPHSAPASPPKPNSRHRSELSVLWQERILTPSSLDRPVVMSMTGVAGRPWDGTSTPSSFDQRRVRSRWAAGESASSASSVPLQPWTPLSSTSPASGRAARRSGPNRCSQNCRCADRTAPRSARSQPAGRCWRITSEPIGENPLARKARSDRALPGATAAKTISPAGNNSSACPISRRPVPGG